MTNGTRVAQAKHFESSAAAAKRFLLSKVLDVTEAVSSEMENLSGMTIDTSQPTVDGALWYAHTNGELQLRLHYGDHDYSFDGLNAYDGGFYTLTYSGGSTEACCSDIVLNAADYPDVTQIISSDGGTIIGGGSVTLFGGANVSLVGSANAEHFLYTGGNVTVSGYGSSDYVSLIGGLSINDTAISGTDLVVSFTDGSSVVGNLTVQNFNKDVRIRDSSKIYYFKPPSLIEFDKDTPSSAQRATVNTTFADFGVQENDSPQGAEIYSCLQYITCTKENSTIIGNAKVNYITICGGENNSLIGGIRADRYYFASGGGTIGDFGINSGTRNSAGTYYAVNVTQKASSTYLAYDRYDHFSYNHGADSLQVNGTVTAIAIPNYSTDDSVTQKLQTVDITVYYVDELNKTHSILFANAVKPFLKAGSNGQYKTLANSLGGIKIIDNVSGSTYYSTTQLKTLIYDPEA